MLKIILPPHLRPAKKVEDNDEAYKTVFEEAVIISKMIKNGECFVPGSKLTMAFALAQPQVSEHPLEYFVINPALEELIKAFHGDVIINPKLISKDKLTRFMSKEGCLSYPYRPIKKVKRFEHIVVSYEVISINDIIKSKGRETRKYVKKIPEIHLEGLPAVIFQHEFQHLRGNSIWEK